MGTNLTPQQRTAVENRGGKLLVSAAAGSGKTKVLVDRLISYILDPIHPANIDDFLIITYTKAAAAELRGKISAKLSECLVEQPGNRHLQRQMQRLYLTKISTVHAFCADMLREYAYKLDIAPDFRVADENECIEIQNFVLEHLLTQKYENADEGFCKFVDTQGVGRNDAQVTDIILQVYNNSRCHLKPEQWLKWCAAEMMSDKYDDAGETVWGKYLIDDLHNYLDHQILALRKCIERASKVDNIEKPVALFESTVAQLQALRNADRWDDVCANSAIDFGRMTFSKKCTDMMLAEQMKTVRKACKKGLDKKLAAFTDSSNAVLTDIHNCGEAATGLIQLVEDFTKLYNDRKRMRRVLDFSDLEQKMLDLVLGKQRSGPTAVAREIGQRFREVMVDEYQDTNEVQDSIFAALTHTANNCFMVGDVKQSIYQFRLADPDIFIEKYNSYRSAETAAYGEGRKVHLSYNFRSSGAVISAVNDVFENCMSAEVGGIDYGIEEALREGIPHCAMDEPEIELYGISVQEDTYAEEATFVASRIKELLDGTHMVRSGDGLRPIVADDIVILLRSPGSVGAEFKFALEKKGIRCTTGAGIDLLQTEEVSFLQSLLQIISNPMQDIPLIAVMSNRVFGFTADELSVIRSKNKRTSFYEAVKLDKTSKTDDFLSLLVSLRMEAKNCRLPQLIQRIFNITRMDSIYAAMPDGLERNENLQVFYQLACDFSSVAGNDLDRFLDYLMSIEEKGLVKSENQGLLGAVRIMSIHKSKGLEFPVVFLCGLSRSFNQESMRAAVICDKELGLGLNCVNLQSRIRYPSLAKRAIIAKMQADSISEEMRVLYVAMTRPRDRLIMTYAAKNLQNELSDIALRCDLSGKELLTKDVSSIGAWVLQTAMRRTEAGAFFQLGGNSGIATVSEYPWKIAVVEATTDSATMLQQTETNLTLGKTRYEELKKALDFRYAYITATQTPSKLTATQLKGRYKDIEIAEGSQIKASEEPSKRRQRFARTRHRGVDRGNAIHAVMQYISYEACTGMEGVSAELSRLVTKGLITEEQFSMVDPSAIVKLFSSAIGEKLRDNGCVLREFKFSILQSGKEYFDDAADDDQILLQGVVDCAIIEEDGITVVDFKTDYLGDGSADILIDRYREQINIYGEALAKIFQKPVKSLLLYSFYLNEFISINA